MQKNWERIYASQNIHVNRIQSSDDEWIVARYR